MRSFRNSLLPDNYLDVRLFCLVLPILPRYERGRWLMDRMVAAATSLGRTKPPRYYHTNQPRKDPTQATAAAFDTRPATGHVAIVKRCTNTRKEPLGRRATRCEKIKGRNKPSTNSSFSGRFSGDGEEEDEERTKFQNTATNAYRRSCSLSLAAGLP